MVHVLHRLDRPRQRSIAITLIACAAALILLAAGTGAARAVERPLTARLARALARNATDHVIVLFKDQIARLPDTRADAARRSFAVAARQAGVLHELHAVRAGRVRPMRLINAIAAVVSRAEAARLADDPAVARVLPDAAVRVTNANPLSQPAARVADAGGAQQACASPDQVQLEPEALQNIHAAASDGGPSAQGLGYTGAGVKVAYLADGLNVNDPDFVRADGSSVFSVYQDFSGAGTSAPTVGNVAFLDASAIAAQGRETYDVEHWGFGLTQPCRIRVLGVAPGASLVGLQILPPSNVFYNSVGLEAIDYAVNVDHVNVINESFGQNPFPDTGGLDLTKLANDAAVAAGVTVVTGSGDAGPAGTFASPASDPAVISAGASTTERIYAQTGFGGYLLPGISGWLDDNISQISSSGFDQTGGGIDVVAPGDLNWALCDPDVTRFIGCRDFHGQGEPVQLIGGTSQSAPFTAGVAALVIQAYAQAHGGERPSPGIVKQIIVSTARDISAPAEEQGAGIVDAYAAVRAAAAYPGGSPSSGPGALITATPKLQASGLPGARRTFSETVTNTGDTPRTVTLASRTLGPYHPIDQQTVQLTDADQGIVPVKFDVSPGQDRLDVAIGYHAAGPPTDGIAAVQITLVTPSGKLAQSSTPFGPSNHANVEVAEPESGRWTAWVYDEAPATQGGTIGPVQFQAATATWQPFGRLSTSSLTLAPGGSGTFRFAVTTRRQPAITAAPSCCATPGRSRRSRPPRRSRCCCGPSRPPRRRRRLSPGS